MFFQINKEYPRAALLDFIGSKQQQSGIIWGPKEPDCVIITSGGRHGKNAGYFDNRNEDGSWYYFGQGSSGDQNPDGYANSLLTQQKKNVLLFSTREPTSKEVNLRKNHKKIYTFEGIFDVLSWKYVVPSEGNRKGDKLVIFELLPANNIFSNFEIETSEKLVTDIIDLKELELKIRSSYNSNIPKIKITITEYKERSKLLKTYTLKRARGICELCNNLAPFVSEKGVPFLEVHHIFRLADDGPDLPENVAALCPNCHRKAHFGVGKESLKIDLHIKVKELLASMR